MTDAPIASSTTEDLIGRLLARLTDAETAIAAGHPADLEGFDAEIQEVVTRVRALPKDQAVFFLGSLQDLLTRLTALETDTQSKQVVTQEQLHPRADQAYKNKAETGTDSTGEDNSGD